MTVSKQFLSEYIDATKHTCNRLEITDIFYTDHKIVLPKWAKPCSSVKFNLGALYDHELDGTLDREFAILEDLVNCYRKQLPTVAEVEIRVNTQTSVSEESIRSTLNRQWIHLPHLKVLDVYRIAEPLGWQESDPDTPVFTYEEPETLLLQFSAETKRVEIVQG